MSAPLVAERLELTDTREASKDGRLLALGALRGVAALMVAIEHIGLSLPASALPDALRSVVAFGANGVSIFFVLSGVVIPYAVGQDRVTPRYVGRFIARRFIRLDVPYWVCIAAYLIAAKIMGKHTFDGVTAPVLLANLFYLNFLLGLQPIVVVGWTLAIEIQFYLAYLLLFGLSQQLTEKLGWQPGVARVVVFAIPVAISVLWQLTIIPDPVGSETVFLQPWLFFFGGAAVTWALYQQMAAWPVALAAAGLLAASGVTREAAPLVGALTVVGIYVAGRMGWLSRKWGPWLQVLGGISYSLYLLRPLVGSRPIRFYTLLQPEPWGVARTALAFALGLVSSLVCAAVFAAIIERPSQRLARRVALVS